MEACEEHCQGLRRAGFAESYCGLCAEVVLFHEELRDERDGGGAFERQQAGVPMTHHFGLFLGARKGEQSQQQDSAVPACRSDGADRFGADRFVGVMDDFEQVQQQGLVTEFGAIDEGVGAVGSQGAGDIGLAAPYRLILVHAQTKHEKLRIGAAEVMEGLAERVLGPALRIFLCCVFEETREGGDELRERFAQIKIACQVSSLGDDEVIGVAQERKEARGCIRRGTGGTEILDRFQVGLDGRVAHLL